MIVWPKPLAAIVAGIAHFVGRWFAPPVLVPAPSPKRRERREAPADGDSLFYFRRNILEKLDRYFVYLRRMRRTDIDAYDLYSRVGATVLPGTVMFQHSGLTHLWLGGTRPSFGAVHFDFNAGPRDADDHGGSGFIYPEFGYFEKLRGPVPGVELVAGDIYKVTTYFDDAIDKTLKLHGMAIIFHVGVSASGEIALLHELVDDPIRFHSRRWRRNVKVERKSAGYPERLRTWHREHLDRKSTNQDIGRFAIDQFSVIANAASAAAAGVQIKVRHGTEAAVFGIAMERVPYFFQDREPVLDAGGRKKRIFHVVRTHARIGGKYVKSHFRGLRRFDWNGYSVTIWVPGKHGLDIPTFDVAGEVGNPRVAGYIDSAGVGDELGKMIH